MFEKFKIGAVMASDKSGNKIFIAILLLGVLKLVYTIVKETIKVLARVIVYFGLYVPFFYFITGSVLVSMGYFSFDVIDIDSILFYVGLGMCLLCALVITIRSTGRNRISCVVDGTAEHIRKAKNELPTRKQSEDRVLSIYHSEDHPELLIEEYRDRFVVYYDDGVNDLQFLRVEQKVKG